MGPRAVEPWRLSQIRRHKLQSPRTCVFSLRARAGFLDTHCLFYESVGGTAMPGQEARLPWEGSSTDWSPLSLAVSGIDSVCEDASGFYHKVEASI